MSFGTSEIYRLHSELFNLVGVPVAAIIITLALGYFAAFLKKIPFVGKFIFEFKLIHYKKI